MPYDVQNGRPATLERGDGVVELVFAKRGPGSGLAHLYQHDPCRVLFPRAEPGDPPVAVLLTTSGGLAGGDRLRFSLTAQDGATATVTTQAAEKVYRSLGPDCRISVSIEVGEALLEWLPQETILFDRARLRRGTRVEIAPGGRFLGAEMLVLGRHARGERFAAGFLHDSWRVSRGGRLIWADALRLDGDVAARLADAYAFDGAGALASALYVSDDAADRLDAARELLADASGLAAVTAVNGILLARFIGRDAAIVRRDLAGYLCGLRHLAADLPPRLPRVWYN